MLFLVSLFLVVNTNKLNYLCAQDSELADIFKTKSPNQFLDCLIKYENYIFVSFGTAPEGWITDKDIDTLITRIYDTTSIPSVVNFLSSYLPNERSCVGREALNMIEAYRDKKCYLEFLYSYGPVDYTKANKIMEWYRKRQ